MMEEASRKDFHTGRMLLYPWSSQTMPGRFDHNSFSYEAERRATNTTRLIKKLRVHYRFIVYQKTHRETYEVPIIRAVLIETLNSDWAEKLPEAARHKVISTNNAPLFWLSASGVFTKAVETQASPPAEFLPFLKHRRKAVSGPCTIFLATMRTFE
jgi:hypothetical protein